MSAGPPLVAAALCLCDDARVRGRRDGRADPLAVVHHCAAFQQRLCRLMDALLAPALQAVRAAAAQAYPARFVIPLPPQLWVCWDGSQDVCAAAAQARPARRSDAAGRCGSAPRQQGLMNMRPPFAS